MHLLLQNSIHPTELSIQQLPLVRFPVFVQFIVAHKPIILGVPLNPRTLAPSRREVKHTQSSTPLYPKTLKPTMSVKVYIKKIKKVTVWYIQFGQREGTSYPGQFKCKVSKRRAGSPPYARAPANVSLQMPWLSVGLKWNRRYV